MERGCRCAQAKLAYLCSQMCCTDEVKMHARCVSLSWVEFLEAIARVAEFLQPPTAEEEAVWIQESIDTDWDEMNQVCWGRKGPLRGCSAGFFIAEDRKPAAGSPMGIMGLTAEFVGVWGECRRSARRGGSS